jgi:hypothetical protein
VFAYLGVVKNKLAKMTVDEAVKFVRFKAINFSPRAEKTIRRHSREVNQFDSWQVYKLSVSWPFTGCGG